MDALREERALCYRRVGEKSERFMALIAVNSIRIRTQRETFLVSGCVKQIGFNYGARFWFLFMERQRVKVMIYTIFWRALEGMQQGGAFQTMATLKIPKV